MAGKSGLITRKDIIEDEALRWGEDYSKEIKKAIDSQGILLKQTKEMMAVLMQYTKVKGMAEFISLKQQEALVTQQALNAMKLEETAMISGEKIKQQQIRTKRELLRLSKDEDNAKKISTKLTLEERVQQQENNKVLKQAILEKMGMVGAYQKLNARRNEAQKTLANLLSAEVRNNAEIRKAQKEFDILDAKVKKVDATTKNYSKNVGNYSSAFKGMGANLSNLMGAFGVVGGVTAFANITRDIFQTTRETQALDLALKQVTRTQDEFAVSQEFLSRISEAYGIEINGLTKSYTGFLAASQNAIDSGQISAQQIKEIFESVSKASGAMGLSVDQQQGAFLALQQMISKGNVQAEEIRGQLAERLPGAFGILAKSMGVTEIELNKLLKDGKVMAAEVLPAFAKELEKAYGVENLKRVESLNAETSRLSNTWVDFVRELNSGDGTVTSVFASLISQLREAVSAWKYVFASSNSKNKIVYEEITDKYYNDTKSSINSNINKVLVERQAILLNIEKLKKISSKSTKDETDKEIAVLENRLKTVEINYKQESAILKDKARLRREEVKAMQDENVNAAKALELENFKLNLQKKPYQKRFTIGYDPDDPNLAIESKIKKNNAAIVEYNRNISASNGAMKALNEVINDTAESSEKKTIVATEMTKAEIAAYERARKKIIDAMRRGENEDFELRKNRIDYNSQANDDILKDDLATLDQKLDALNENAQLDASLSRETLEHKLKMNALEKEGLEKLSVAKFNLYIKESDARIKLLMNGQLAVKDMTVAEKILYEKAENDKIALLRKTEKEQQRIIDSEVAKFQTKLDSDKATQERLMNEAIEAENIRFKETRDLEAMNMADREKAIRDHEERIAHIKKQAALDLLKIQIDGLEKELAANDAKDEKDRVSAEVRKKIAEDLQKAKTDFTELELQNHVDTLNKKQLTEKEFNEKVKEMSQDLAYALADFANALFDRRIQNIDDEISKNEEYYNRQIELAGNDTAQKDLLEQESEKKRLELEKKKRTEQQKQAIFNKAIAVTEIGIKTAMAVVAALAVGPPQGYVFAALSGALGLAQLATVLATPIPKYEKGTKNHPGGPALVGEKRPEVINEPGKDPYIVRSPAILNLAKGTEVVPSIAEYNKLQRASFMASLQMEGRKVNDFQASQVFNDKYSEETLAVMKETLRAIKNQKNNIIVNVPKIDIPHEIWKSKNTSWN